MLQRRDASKSASPMYVIVLLSVCSTDVFLFPASWIFANLNLPYFAAGGQWLHWCQEDGRRDLH